MQCDRFFLYCLLCNCIGKPIAMKIVASRDFLGGLAAFIFTTGSRLAAIFTAYSSFADPLQKS